MAADNSHLFVFTGVASNKAGVSADKKMVADFVYERSKNSKYTQRARDLDAKQQARTEAIAAELHELETRMSSVDLAEEERRASAALSSLEAKRQLMRTYCVVDMDMFYAAVEIRDQPHLREKPVAIGGIGMISTANYVARLYGVRSAMPGFIAQEMVRNPQLVGAKMPPDELIFIPTNFEKYTRVAEETREIFREYDPNLHSMSLDEAYLDLTAYLEKHAGSTAGDVVDEMRRRVKEKKGLTCSAGIGPNSMIAKICSDDNKPDGQCWIASSPEAVLEYIEALPVRRIPGVGKVLERQLKVMLNVATVGDLRRNAARVIRAFDGKQTKDFLLRVSLGLSDEEVHDMEGDAIGDVDRKSLSNERTFSAEGSLEVLSSMLQDLCRMVAEEMATAAPPLAARGLSLKTKTDAFEVRNRQVQCSAFLGFEASFAKIAAERSEAAGSSIFDQEVQRVAEDMYRRLLPCLEDQLPCKFRLIGVRVSNFRSARQTLERGQQQLRRFFGAGPSPASPKAKVKDVCADILDIQSSEDGSDGEVVPKSSKEVGIGDVVVCPVCGEQVPISNADAHVNQHYDIPNSSSPADVVGTSSAIARTRKRKEASSGGRGPKLRITDLLRPNNDVGEDVVILSQ